MGFHDVPTTRRLVDLDCSSANEFDVRHWVATSAHRVRSKDIIVTLEERIDENDPQSIDVRLRMNRSRRIYCCGQRYCWFVNVRRRPTDTMRR
jgi:hypothetical protein